MPIIRIDAEVENCCYECPHGYIGQGNNYSEILCCDLVDIKQHVTYDDSDGPRFRYQECIDLEIEG